MTGSYMNQSREWVKLSALIFCLAVAPPASMLAQDPTCKRFVIQDGHMPSYPPIAHAAHMEATMRFRVTVPQNGSPEITFLSGPSQGIWQSLVTNAQNYLSDRKYWWSEGTSRAACSYTATVEYRFISGELDPPNNFLRVTVMDETHTLVEVKSTTPTVNY
jgi:hypothetical protein